MSRTEEDIVSGVDITIMRDTTLRTYPASYSEVCDTFRPRLARARAIGRTAYGRPVIPLPQATKYQFRCSAPAQSSSRPHPQERHFLPGVNRRRQISRTPRRQFPHALAPLADRNSSGVGSKIECQTIGVK